MTFARTLIAGILLAPAPFAFAHSPIFPKDNHDPSHAYQITNPLKSWAVYTTLAHQDKGDYYQFTVSKGDTIEIGLMTSQSPSVSGFLPSFALMVPESELKSGIPSSIEVPAGYGTIVSDGKDPGKASYEPFSPGWYYDVAGLTISAPVEGTYYIVVYDRGQKTGNYVLPVGYIESFTPAEWLTLPYSVHATYVWEGQNLFVTYLPLILVIVVGGFVIWRVRRNKAPRDLSKWLAAFSGLAFLGTTAGIIYQMTLDIGVTGFSPEVAFTFIFITIGLLLGVLAFMYALREKPALSPGRRTALIVMGIFAIVGWAGFYIGPVLLFAAALVPRAAAAKSL